MLIGIAVIAGFLSVGRCVYDFVHYANRPDESLLRNGESVVVFGEADEQVPDISPGLKVGTRCAVLLDFAGDDDDCYGNSSRPVHIKILEGQHAGETVKVRRVDLRSLSCW